MVCSDLYNKRGRGGGGGGGQHFTVFNRHHCPLTKSLDTIKSNSTEQISG